MFGIETKLNNKTIFFALVCAAIVLIVVTLVVVSNIKVTPKTSVLTVTTTPAGADIAVDGSSVGLSPQTLTLSRKTHKIDITSEYYKAVNGQIDLEQGNVNKSYQLEPLYVLPFVGDDFGIECSTVDVQLVCTVNIYNSPFEKYKAQADDYLKKAGIDIKATAVEYNDTVINGGEPG